MIYLLDTDTCIYWLKNITSVTNKIQTIGWENICICNITVAELYFGAYNSQKLAENLTRAENFIQNIAVITLDNNAVKKFGELKAELRKIGQQVADFDLLIASVALTRTYILVTNNTRHYSRISELKLENWFSP